MRVRDSNSSSPVVKRVNLKRERWMSITRWNPGQQRLHTPLSRAKLVIERVNLQNLAIDWRRFDKCLITMIYIDIFHERVM